MKVRAKNRGYYDLNIVPEGHVFDMDEKDLYKRDKSGKIILDKDGKPVLPQWIELVRFAKKKVEEEIQEIEDEFDDAPLPMKKGKGKDV